MEESGVPAFAGNQLDQRFAFDIIDFLTQRKSKARRDIAHAARAIDLPQPVCLTLFKFAQKQRDDLAFVFKIGFGNFAIEEIARGFKRADRNEHLKACRHGRCGDFIVTQERSDTREA